MCICVKDPEHDAWTYTCARLSYPSECHENGQDAEAKLRLFLTLVQF